MDDAPPTPPSTPTIGLVPLRTGGKSRLGAGLPPEQRDALVLAMLDDVLAALRGAGVDDVRILAGNAAAVTAARARGLTALADPPATQPSDAPDARSTVDRGDLRLRAAVDGALAQVSRSSDRLVVAADLPRLRAADVAQVLAHPAQVVIAPTAGGGTAILRLAAGTLLPTRYGVDSAEQHVRAAERAGLSVAIVDLPGGRHDVDAMTDLAALGGALDGSTPGPATSAFVAGVRG
jgi:2-phospho-L-lactate guanylyltransferase